jgi:hypothetical protein
MISVIPSLRSYFYDCRALIQRTDNGNIDQFKIGGHRICLQIPDTGLREQILPALQHLKAPSDSHAEFTVFVTHAGSDGIELPAPDWGFLPFAERGNLRLYSDEDFSLIYNHRIGVFNILNHADNEAIYWSRSRILPYYERSAPLRHLLQAWLQRRGLFITHASAVGRADGGLLIAGRTGSGKSTTALLALRAGFLYAGDDYILTQAQPDPYIYSIYNSAKINSSSLHWFPEWKSRVHNSTRLHAEKALIFLNNATEGYPLRAIVLPRVTSERLTIARPLPPEEMFRTIVPDTVFTSLGDASLVVKSFKRLIEQLPGYRLELGSQLEQIPSVLANLLDQLQ